MGMGTMTCFWELAEMNLTRGLRVLPFVIMRIREQADFPETKIAVLPPLETSPASKQRILIRMGIWTSLSAPESFPVIMVCLRGVISYEMRDRVAGQTSPQRKLELPG